MVTPALETTFSSQSVLWQRPRLDAIIPSNYDSAAKNTLYIFVDDIMTFNQYDYESVLVQLSS